MQKPLAILAVSFLLSAPASAAVVLGGPVDLSSGAPFIFGPSSTDQFSLSYPMSGLFADTFVSTSGTAEVTAFGGFLGIPLQPTVDFTDGRGGDVVYGPEEFGGYASFPTATDIPFSSTDSFLGLRYAAGANTFYGFAQFAGSDLERYGFETTPNTAINASAAIAAVPELSTWAMMLCGFAGLGFVGYRQRTEHGVASTANARLADQADSANGRLKQGGRIERVGKAQRAPTNAFAG